MIGPVVMRCPADPQMSRVARLAVSGLASLGGFDVEVIEDIKIAVSEVILALIEQGDGDELSLTFFVDRSAVTLTIEGSTVAGSVDLASVDLELCRSVLAGVSDVHTIQTDGERVVIRVTLSGAPA